MSYCCSLLAVVAALVSVAAANYYDTTPAATCYKEGEKCMGAEGYQAIPWLGCCDGYECKGEAHDWGFVCVKAQERPTVLEPKCHEAGEKCKGADGHPYIPYLGCCDGYVCEGKADDWGSVCIKQELPKCYNSGEKCIGAEGYPAIPWLGCCDGLVCAGQADDWGVTCVEPESVAKPEPTLPRPEPTTTKPATTTKGRSTAAPTCLIEGETCGMELEACCDSLSCIDKYYGRMTCEREATTPPGTTIPRTGASTTTMMSGGRRTGATTKATMKGTTATATKAATTTMAATNMATTAKLATTKASATKETTTRTPTTRAATTKEAATTRKKMRKSTMTPKCMSEGDMCAMGTEPCCEDLSCIEKFRGNMTCESTATMAPTTTSKATAMPKTTKRMTGTRRENPVTSTAAAKTTAAKTTAASQTGARTAATKSTTAKATAAMTTGKSTTKGGKCLGNGDACGAQSAQCCSGLECVKGRNGEYLCSVYEY